MPFKPLLTSHLQYNLVHPFHPQFTYCFVCSLLVLLILLLIPSFILSLSIQKMFLGPKVFLPLTLCSNDIISFPGGIVGADWWLSIWSSDRPRGNTSADHDVDYYLVGYTSLSIAAVVLTFFKSISIAICCLRGAKLLHIRMLRRVIQAPMRFFDTTPIGRVLNRMSSDTAAIDSNLPCKLIVHVRFTPSHYNFPVTCEKSAASLTVVGAPGRTVKNRSSITTYPRLGPL